MPTRIVIISDTHFYRWDEVHPEIRAAVRDADIAIHCGDIVRQDVVDGMRREAKRAIIVHGNSDPPDLRRSLPYTEVLEIDGLRIGVTPIPLGAARSSRWKTCCPTSQNPWTRSCSATCTRP